MRAKRTKEVLAVVMVLMVTLASLQLSVFAANGYNNGEVTIDIAFTAGDLQATVEAIHTPVSEITSLIITEGVVNQTDFYYMRDNLASLETLEISGNAVVESSADIVGPAEADHKVPEDALKSHTSVSEVTISDATVIGNSAFWQCNNLENISSPQVVTIEDYAFYYCGKLETTDFSKLETIQEGAFYLCGVLSSAPGDAAITIEKNAFRECRGLESLSLPVVERIGNFAFANCSGLDTLTLGATIPPDMNATVFSGCPSPRTLTVPAGSEGTYGAVVDGDSSSETWYGWTISGPVQLSDENDITSFTVVDAIITDIDGAAHTIYVLAPEGTVIADLAPGFVLSNNASATVELVAQVSGITSNDYTNSVTYVVTAEDGGTQSWDVTMELFDGQIIIDDTSGYTCGNLGEAISGTGITLDLIKSLVVTCGIINQTDMQWMRDNLNNLESLEISSSCQVHSDTSKPLIADGIVPGYAMSDGINNNNKLVSVKIDSAVGVSGSAFAYCTGLTSVDMPNVTSIGQRGFIQCRGLESIQLPSIDTILSRAFEGCSSLTSVEMGEILESGYMAFADCTSFSALTIGSVTPPSIITSEFIGAFNNCSADRSVTVPDYAGPAYVFANDDDVNDGLWYGWKVIDNGVSDETGGDEINSGETLAPTLSGVTATGTYDMSTETGEVVASAISNMDGKIYILRVYDPYYDIASWAQPVPTAGAIIADGQVVNAIAGVSVSETFSEVKVNSHLIYFLAVDEGGNRSQIVRKIAWISPPNPDEDWGDGDYSTGGDETTGGDSEENNGENESTTSSTSSSTSTSSTTLVKYTLEVSSTEGGSSTFEGTTSHERGTIVNLNITTEEGYTFIGFEGDISNQDPLTHNVTMLDDITLKAVFEKVEQDIEEELVEEEPEVIEAEEVSEELPAEEEILDAELPEADVPQTGGMPIEVLGLAGSVLGGIGVAIRRKKK